MFCWVCKLVSKFPRACKSELESSSLQKFKGISVKLYLVNFFSITVFFVLHPNSTSGNFKFQRHVRTEWSGTILDSTPFKKSHILVQV